MIHELLSPDFCVSLITAFKQCHDDCTLESTGNVTRMHALANLLRKLRQYFFSIENADVTTHLSEVIGLDKCQCVQTGLWFAFETLGHAFQELGAMK